MSEMSELETQAIEELETDLERATSSGMSMPMSGRPRTGARSGAAVGAMGPQHMGAPHPADLAAIKRPSIGSRIASGVKKVGAAVSQAVTPRQPAFARGIECPHCGGGLSKGYAVQALKILAKSEGHNFDDELDGLDDPDAAKAHPDMPIDTHRGPHKPGKLHQSSRPGKGQPVVERKNKPTSPTIGKSLNLPILDGPAQIVQYTNDADVPLSKSIEEGGLHVPPARNMRAEREMAGFDTEE